METKKENKDDLKQNLINDIATYINDNSIVLSKDTTLFKGYKFQTRDYYTGVNKFNFGDIVIIEYPNTCYTLKRELMIIDNSPPCSSNSFKYILSSNDTELFIFQDGSYDNHNEELTKEEFIKFITIYIKDHLLIS